MNNLRYDAIILLGGAISPDGSLDNTDKARLEKAARLYKNDTANVIIVCGSHGYKEIERPTLSEAQVYANYLENFGVPRSAIYLETESQETLGNLLFTKMQILMKHDWHTLLVLPTYNHSSERVRYLLKKILGSEYSWDILREDENKEPTNLEREAKSLKLTKDINDRFADGDHEAIHKGLMETHPAYGGTKWTVDELRKTLGN